MLRIFRIHFTLFLFDAVSYVTMANVIIGKLTSRLCRIKLFCFPSDCNKIAMNFQGDLKVKANNLLLHITLLTIKITLHPYKKSNLNDPTDSMGGPIGPITTHFEDLS